MIRCGKRQYKRYENKHYDINVLIVAFNVIKSLYGLEFLGLYVLIANFFILLKLYYCFNESL